MPLVLSTWGPGGLSSFHAIDGSACGGCYQLLLHLPPAICHLPTCRPPATACRLRSRSEPNPRCPSPASYRARGGRDRTVAEDRGVFIVGGVRGRLSGSEWNVLLGCQQFSDSEQLGVRKRTTWIFQLCNIAAFSSAIPS